MKNYLSKPSYSFVLIQLLITLLFSITLAFLIIVILHPANIFSQSEDDIYKPAQLPDNPPEKIYGVTIDAVSGLNNIANTLDRHNKRMTTRIVFDEWQPAYDYIAAVNRLDTITDIMGELLDSYYVDDYSVQQYTDRAVEYVYSPLGDKVDIWEIGNEINGEWLGNKDSVILKLTKAFIVVRKAGKKTALTLYYNKNCWENPQNEMFRWVNANIPVKIKFSLDYVFVSYYEDDCNNYQPNWQQVFDSLRVIFPNSMLGIGECGTTIASRKAEYINRYYSMNITTPGYVGGYFWWYYRQDCVPWTTKPLWQVLDNAIMNSGSDNIIRDGDGY
jgi:hypothetical protein